MATRPNQKNSNNLFDFELLKGKREEKGLSKADMLFALAQGGFRISRPGYDAIESGATAPRLDFVLAVTTVLGLDRDFFFLG